MISARCGCGGRKQGLWEKDPAAPPEGTHADLLGIAFDPNDPAIGYAVGLGGVLWRYDKTWTQEPLPEPFQKDAKKESTATRKRP